MAQKRKRYRLLFYDNTPRLMSLKKEIGIITDSMDNLFDVKPSDAKKLLAYAIKKNSGALYKTMIELIYGKSGEKNRYKKMTTMKHERT